MPFPHIYATRITPPKVAKLAGKMPLPKKRITPKNTHLFWQKMAGNTQTIGYQNPANDLITQITPQGTSTPSHTYQYDKLDRLSDWLPSTPNSSNTHWTFDPNHNRTSQTQSTSVQQSTTLSPTSNRVSAFNTSAPSYNNAGSLTQDSSRKYTYNGLERISLIQNLSNTTLMAASYNGLGQRHWRGCYIMQRAQAERGIFERETRRLCLINKRFERKNNKVMPSAVMMQLPRKEQQLWQYPHTYDENGHTTGEYTYGSFATPNANARLNQAQETLWLGDTPIAILDSTPNTPAPINSNTGNAARLIHTDHLNTPRSITSATGAILWTWQGDPFGNSQPSQAAISPTISNAQIGATAQGYTYNQRFAGQTYDKETGLYYNYFRHYDPATGRYVEADPIGLEGGWNRYAYVGGNPLGAVDPRGLSATGVAAIVGTAVFSAIALKSGDDATKAYPDNDKKKHCMASCLATKRTLWVGAPVVSAAGVVWEWVSPLTGHVYDAKDIEANNEGVKNAFIYKNCEQACASCQVQGVDK